MDLGYTCTAPEIRSVETDPDKQIYIEDTCPESVSGAHPLWIEVPKL